MRVLITGAAGFLGSHLTDRFLADGYHVIGMDNLITGSLDNIAHLKDDPRFEFVRHDVTRFIDVKGDLDGVLVANVEQGSPAKAAGILAGDLILSINEESVQAKFEEEIPAVLQAISDFPIGSTLELKVARVGGTEDITLVSD